MNGWLIEKTIHFLSFPGKIQWLFNQYGSYNAIDMMTSYGSYSITSYGRSPFYADNSIKTSVY